MILATSAFRPTGLWNAILADIEASVLVTPTTLRIVRFNLEREELCVELRLQRGQISPSLGYLTQFFSVSVFCLQSRRRDCPESRLQ